MEYLSAKLANYILKKGLIDTEAYEIYQGSILKFV